MNQQENIYNNFLNGKFKILHFKKEKELPEEVTINDAIFYYIQYQYTKITNDIFFKENAYFVCIPETEFDYTEQKFFIDVIVKLKYSIDKTRMIKLI